MANKQFRFIAQMTFEEKQAFFDSFDTVFCDCDGVIWNIVSGAIVGSADAIKKLQGLGKKVVFVTNNSTLSSEEYLRKFKKYSIQLNQKDIVHPAQTICSYLKQINFKGLIYCIASASFRHILHESGFQLVDEANPTMKTVKELQAAIHSDDHVDHVMAVLIDVDFNLTAFKLIQAQIHLKNPNCLFLAGAADTLVSFGQLEVLGPGLFIELLEKATKRHAQVFGKPGIQLRNVLKEKYSYGHPSRVLFIGDSVSSDIKFAKICGFQTMLVLSGGAKSPDLNNLTKSDQLGSESSTFDMPDFVANSLADFL